MNVTIHCEDKRIVKDGVGVDVVGPSYPTGVWCIQWDGVQAEIEYLDKSKPNKITNSFSEYQYLLDAYEAEILVIAPTAPTLEEAKTDAKSEIDQAATATRYRFVSANKDATYLNKSAELDRYIAAGRPDPVIENEYPYLYNEALETEMTVTAVANLIETTRAMWVPSLDPVIEGKCRGGKVKVENATTFEEVESIRDSAIAALNAI